MPATPTTMEPRPTATPRSRDRASRLWREHPGQAAAAAATSEKTMGAHSTGRAKPLAACASAMSTARKARLPTTNSAPRARASRRRASARQASWLRWALGLGAPSGRLARAAPRPAVQLVAQPQQLVVAVPLHEVGAAHEGAVLRGPAEVVPEVELGELDRLVERLGRQQPLLAQRRR